MTGPAEDAAARGKALYDFGNTPIFACKSDPRFSYCLYVPPGTGPGQPADLMVAMHGTGRSFVEYRDAFAPFGKWNRCIVMAPLFPIGVKGDGNRDGFKYIQEGDVRYDRVLLSMVDEVAERYGIDLRRIAMFGYSGGGHFVHRFLMLHPNRLWAVAIGAPGSVTLLDPTRDFWVGTRDFEKRFETKIDTAAMAKVAVQMIVGAADLETWEITHREGGRYWMPDANHAGATRPERLQSLKASFEKAGIKVQLDLVPNMAHDGMRAVSRVENFFADALARRRAAPAAAAE